MKVSVNWVKEFLDFELPPVGELVDRIGAQLGAIEEVIDLGAQYSGLIIVKVVDCQKLKDSDHLNVCKIDDGHAIKDIERDERGYVQVVCGAPNVRSGIMVVWLPPGSTVPSTHSKEPFVLGSRNLRGVLSNGMLASPKELAIADNHEGILELDSAIDEDDETVYDKTLPVNHPKPIIHPGDDFAHSYGLDDYIIDIENKMFTHRPDCFGMLGVAREIAGILGHEFHSPEIYRAAHDIDQPDGPLLLEVHNELTELVPHVVVRYFSGLTIGPSPVWMQTYLSRVGIRPINNVVDITNYFMVLTGQPMHAYDYDKVVALDPGATHATLVIRYPHHGEKLLLLNGKEVTPRPEAIVIATEHKAIGLGGVMGGADTEVDTTTHAVILECATFDMYSIRRTAMAQGVFSDAVTRFNKGQSPLQNERIVNWATNELLAVSQAVPGSYIDINNLPEEIRDRNSVYSAITVTTDFINARLGLELDSETITRLLSNVEFTIESHENEMHVIAPFWRTDIELREDVVEEVGRLYGFDKLPLDLPQRTISPVSKDQMLEVKAKARITLAKAGANEVLTYSFVHSDLFEKTGQNKAEAFRIGNAISPDLQYYRMSLTPSLLERVHPNLRTGYAEFALFEIGKAHVKSELDASQNNVPKEVNALSLVVAFDDKHAQKEYQGAPYYLAKHYLQTLLHEHNLHLPHDFFVLLAEADLGNNPWLEQMTAPYDPKRSAVLHDSSGLIWGVVGEFKQSVRKSLKLPKYCAGFELDPLFLQRDQGIFYRPLPRYPYVNQDICFKVANSLRYGALFDFVWAEVGKLTPDNTLSTLLPIDIYQRDDDQEHKQITLRLSIASYERTMTDAEVSQVLSKVSEAVATTFHAERI